MKQPATYIMTNKRNGALYIGVTSNLIKRVYQHRNGQADGFTAKYKCYMLVYYELHDTMDAAITREKQLKGWIRRKKLVLIENMNPSWRDLWEDIAGSSF